MTPNLPRRLFVFIWQVSSWHQLGLSILSVAVFLLNTAPLELHTLGMGIYKWTFTMKFLINLFHHFGVATVFGIGGWYVLIGNIQLGTVVAFISGLAAINDPWVDLVCRHFGFELGHCGDTEATAFATLLIPMPLASLARALRSLSGSASGLPG
jgi:hypothetical protein